MYNLPIPNSNKNPKTIFIYVISALLVLLSILLIISSSKNEGFWQLVPSPNSVNNQAQPPSPNYTQTNSQTRKTLSPNTPQPSPTPTPDPQTYACGPGGACNSYLNPISADCPIIFKDRYCKNKCGNPSLRCRI